METTTLEPGHVAQPNLERALYVTASFAFSAALVVVLTKHYHWAQIWGLRLIVASTIACLVNLPLFATSEPFVAPEKRVAAKYPAVIALVGALLGATAYAFSKEHVAVLHKMVPTLIVAGAALGVVALIMGVGPKATTPAYACLNAIAKAHKAVATYVSKPFSNFLWLPLQMLAGLGYVYGKGSLDPVPCVDVDGTIGVVPVKLALPRKFYSTPAPRAKVEGATRLFAAPLVRPYSDQHVRRRVGIGPVVADFTPMLFNIGVWWLVTR